MQKLTSGTTVPVEDYRVTRAREVLAESQRSDSIGEAARWWGQLEASVSELLDVIGERL